MAAIEKIALTLLRTPKMYLRKRVRPDYVQKLVADAREVMQDGGKGPLRAAMWPFPPIVVREVEEAPKKEGDKPLIVYEVIDGNNRTEAARTLYEGKLGDFSVPARIVKLTDAEAFAEQIKLNLANGMYLDRGLRDGGIRTLVKDMKMSTREVARRTGVSYSSVSRIANAKQGKGYASESMKRKGPRGKGRRKGDRAARAAAKTAWTVVYHIRQCEALSRDFEEHQPEIEEAMKKLRAKGREFRVGRPFAEFVKGLAA